MSRVKVFFAAFPDVSLQLVEIAKQRVTELLGDNWEPCNSQNVDLVWFITGGSEKGALYATEFSKRVLLAGNFEENSYAAASEVKSFLDVHQRKCILLSTSHKNFEELLKLYIHLILKLNQLDGSSVGMIGTISDWLINSNIKSNTLQTAFGIELKQYLWNQLPNYQQLNPNSLFIDSFTTSNHLLDETSKVFNLLNQIIHNEKLDAITVECFSLVKKNSVTACLPLSKLNDLGIPAGCEGDMCSIVGMMLLQKVTGSIPWMANLINIKSPIVSFAHCTVPLSNLENYEITTHFETGKGTAIKGQWPKTAVTVFRLNANVDKAFISLGSIVQAEQIENACRTQIAVEMNQEKIAILANHPIGNHHLILKGDYTELLIKMCQLEHIEVV